MAFQTAIIVRKPDPLMRDSEVIGGITLRQSHLTPFTASQIEAIETFADQAVIAIGNVRLFEEVQARAIELVKSLEQQTATSEVLQVISSSQGKLEPVFQKMLEKATHVCGANFGTMNLWDGESVNIAASYKLPPAFAAWRQRTPSSSRKRPRYCHQDSSCGACS